MKHDLLAIYKTASKTASGENVGRDEFNEFQPRPEYKPDAQGFVDLLSRLGDSHGFATTEPWLSPKRLTQRNRIELNQQAGSECVFPRVRGFTRSRFGFVLQRAFLD